MKHILILLTLGVLLIGTVQAQENETASETTVTTPEPTPVPAADPQAAEQALRNAYEKEYAFLTAQVKDIRTRIASYETESAAQSRQIEQQINALENEMLDLANQADRLSQDIYEVERTSESAEDNKGLLESTIVQASATLEEYNLKPVNDEAETVASEIEQVRALVTAAVELTAEKSSITRTDGSFYLADGREVTGSITRVGNIAAYGQSSEGNGVLAPAGDNRFKIWNDADNQAATALLSGQPSTVTPVFLFESSLKAIEESQGKTIMGVIASGGIIAWIIAVLGMIALVLIILRFVFLKLASSSTESLLRQVVERIRDRDVPGAIKLCGMRKSSNSRVLGSALRNLDKDRDHLEDIVSESILHESSQLNRFGSLILVIATVSPLLGLLGTVTGMIATFDIITEFGTGDPALLSGGISIALVTTEIGLAVAIPTLLFGNVLSGWAERIKDDMEKAALRAINVFHDVKKD